MIEIRPLFIAVSAAFTAASLRHDKRVRNDAACDGFSKREFFETRKRHLRSLHRCIQRMFLKPVEGGDAWASHAWP